jgi:hypothetical protein
VEVVLSGSKPCRFLRSQAGVCLGRYTRIVVLTCRYVRRYVVCPLVFAGTGIGALFLTLLPAYRPSALAAHPAIYLLLWLVLATESLLTAWAARRRVLRPYIQPRWEPGQPQRLARKGMAAWSVLGWVAVLIVVVNLYIVFDVNGGFFALLF